LTEFFFVVDEDDNVLRKASREECHSDRSLIHRSVYIFVVNGRNEVYLQKRSMSKDLYPGYYTGSATGHVDYGEEYDEAARRELREELGISAPLLSLGKVKSFTGNEREISMLYVCRHDGQIKFNAKEVTEGGFYRIKDVKRSIRTGEKKFADGFLIAFKELMKYIRVQNR
jgi:isopentenyl-diphosphate delta-isomerase type 1